MLYIANVDEASAGNGNELIWVADCRDAGAETVVIGDQPAAVRADPAERWSHRARPRETGLDQVIRTATRSRSDHLLTAGPKEARA